MTPLKILEIKCGACKMTQRYFDDEKIPNGWKYQFVGEVVEKISLTNKKLKQSEYKANGKIPVIDQGKKFIGGYTNREEMKTKVRSPVVIFGDHTRVMKFVNFDFVAGADGVKVLKPLNFFNPRLFYYFLQAIELPKRGYSRHYQFLSKSMIPVPPLPEQIRIANKIDQLFSLLDSGIESLRKVERQSRVFHHAVLKSAFEGELTKKWRKYHKDELFPASKLLDQMRKEIGKSTRNENSTDNYKASNPYLQKLPSLWAWTSIGEIKTFIGSGITPRGGKRVYSDKGIPFIRSQNVYPDGLQLEDVVHISPEQHKEMKRTQLRPSDVLLNITGASIGRSTYVPQNFCEANVNQHVCIIRTGWWIKAPFLSYFLNSTYGQEQIFSMESGMTRQGLNYGQIRKLFVPLAPLREQEEVAARIEQLWSVAGVTERTVSICLRQAEKLRQRILKEAFAGKLVPQNSLDERVEKSSDRIRADEDEESRSKRDE